MMYILPLERSVHFGACHCSKYAYHGYLTIQRGQSYPSAQLIWKRREKQGADNFVVIYILDMRMYYFVVLYLYLLNFIILLIMIFSLAENVQCIVLRCLLLL